MPIITLGTISYQIAKEELDHEIMYGANARVNELNDMIQQKLVNKEMQSNCLLKHLLRRL
ncbi:hypothetical protein ACEQPO_23495 [Bacillus sp. SL00103]